jgi:hypothetical protein
MLTVIVGTAISWYFGFAPIFIAGAILSIFAPGTFRFLFWLFTFPFILALDASALTLLASLYNFATLSTDTFHTSLYVSIIPAFLITNYLAGDVT